MKKIVFIIFLFFSAYLWSADKSLITVKDSSVNNGVVIVGVHQAGTPFELQCNQSAPNCVAPKPGTYWMVRLPKNHGLYDCANVDLYPQTVDPESGGKLLGEYCLNEK